MRTEDQKEFARRELRALLQRREFLALTGGVIASVTGLAGCSSTDSGTTPPPPGGIPAGMHPATGTVSLPAGSSLSLATMTVDIAGQSAAVSSAGQFTVGISPTGPSLALLLDSNGDPVYSAIFDPTASSYGVSSQTTAVALLYYGVGGCYYPPSVSSRILALLSADSSVAAIDTAVAGAVRSDPHAVTNGATTIASAVGTALQQIFPASLRTAGAAAKLHEFDVPTLLSVTPSASQDGISVDQDTAATAVIVTNTWRRPTKVFVYRVSTQTGTQPVVPIQPAERVSGPTDLSSTENISLFTALKDIVKGISPASPVSLPSIPLDLNTGTDRTSYQVVVIEASAWTHIPFSHEPAFYGDPHYVNELGDWRLAASDLFNETLVGELAMPLLCLLGGFGAITLTHAELTAAVKAGEAAFAAARAQLVAGLDFGSMGKLSGSLIKAIKAAMSDDILASGWKNEVKVLLGAIDAKALQAQTTTELAARLSKGVSMFLKVFEVIAGVGLVLDVFDTGLIMTHFIESNVGVLWDAAVIRQLLGLTPQSPVAASGDHVSFQVSNPVNAQGGTYEYDWTQNSPFATLSATDAVGTAITTHQRNVDLVTTPSDVNPVRVSVIGYDTSSGQRVEIGRAATTVTFVPRALITPGGPFIDRNAQQTFVASLAAGPAPGASYVWTLTGGLGSIGATDTVTTTVPQIVFTAGSVGGTGGLHVDVYAPGGGGNLIAKGDTTINVAGPSMINVLITGSGWDPDRTPANHDYVYTDDHGVREPVPEEGNPNDAIFLPHNIAGDGTIGVLVTMIVLRGVLPVVNQNFSKWVSGGPEIGPGQWQLSMSRDQSDVENSQQWAIAGTGSLKVDGIGQLPDGTWVMNYSAVVDNGAGGTAVVSGTDRFK